MSKQRKRFTGEEKVRALRRHLVDKVAVSEVCEQLGIQPTQFYRWQQQFFENGASAVESKTKSNVLAELMEEHVALKKNLGEI